MIVFKKKQNKMIEKLIQKLEAERIDEYEIVNDVPDKNVSINSDLDSLMICIPRKLEYIQYDISDYLRALNPGVKTMTDPDRDLYRMKVRGKLTEAQYFKLIKFLIESNDFCSIIDE